MDRYGDVPQSVMGLIDISLLRVSAAALGITEIVQRKDNIIFYGEKYSDIDMAGFLKEIKYKIGVSASPKPYISAVIPAGNPPLEVMKEVLKTLNSNRRPAEISK